MKVVHLSILSFLSLGLLVNGCFFLDRASNQDIMPFELDNKIVSIEKTINKARVSFESENFEKTRELCDTAIKNLFEIKPALNSNEYERLHGEIAVLRLKSNNTNRAESAAIKSDLFPLVFNSRVEKWINYYTGRGRKYFTKWVKRSVKYITDIEEIFKQYGLPLDLAYVPIIESGFYPFATSKASAVGLWQFIKSTAKLNGLEINYWIDERRDPYKATHAAAKVLKDLYEQFGTWELVLAGYNYGPNGVKSRIRKWDTKDYWALYLPRETEHFVPKIMAAIFIMKEPEMFGFKPVKNEEYVWKEYEVKDCVDLRDIAKWSGCDIKEIQMLNPELKQMCTPPGKEYRIRIPSENYDKFVKNFNQAEENEKYLSQKEINKRIRRLVYYRVRRGDSIWKISRKFNVSMYKIRKWNNLTSNTIYPRQLLKIYRHGI
ncbi:MAG: transglycosylase SLT domain-containing protein [Elusimicrobiota bacterium]